MNSEHRKAYLRESAKRRYDDFYRASHLDQYSKPDRDNTPPPDRDERGIAAYNRALHECQITPCRDKGCEGYYIVNKAHEDWHCGKMVSKLDICVKFGGVR